MNQMFFSGWESLIRTLVVGVMAYVVLTLAVIIRVAGPLAGPVYPRMIDASAAAWVLAFAIFSFQYWPMLTRPRVS